VRRIETEFAPKPGGHYSQATVFGGVAHVSGQLPIVPGVGPSDPGPIEDQIRQALANFLAIVEAAGGSAATVLKVTIYLSDIEAWGAANRIFAEMFGEHRPARAIVPVPVLHYGYSVEVDGEAAVSA